MRPGRSSRWSAPRAGRKARSRKPTPSRCEPGRAEAVEIRHRSEEAMNLAGRSLQIPAGGVALDADLMVPEPAGGAVLFPHGSGSSRPNPRHPYRAGEPPRSGLAHLLAHLLPPPAEQIDPPTSPL